MCFLVMAACHSKSHKNYNFYEIKEGTTWVLWNHPRYKLDNHLKGIPKYFKENFDPPEGQNVSSLVLDKKRDYPRIMSHKRERTTVPNKVTTQEAMEHVDGRSILQERPFQPDDRFPFYQQFEDSGLLRLVQPRSERNLAFVKEFYYQAK
ncbi:uncharacterized protein G2W53_007936 [Senna tora]|uniref:Uncharacterized protein n=1 Tax=Senna tora TaxID=362788 RepID=A0A834X7C9_9FABA|nr:uncharacterized protein G2W53_007936 [Senna tora]